MSSAEPLVEEVPLADIVVDKELQSRNSKLDEAQVKRYSIAMTQDDEFPPIYLARINSVLFVIDGFHRIEATRLNGESKISAVIKSMSREDAKWEGGKQNLQHGLPLKSKDKLPMFKAYIAAGGHRKKRRGAFKTYREMASDFHGHLAASTVLKWIKSYYPSIYSAMGQREFNGTKEAMVLDHGEHYYGQALEGVATARKLSPALTSPERRYKLIQAMEEALLEMKKMPHVQPPPEDF
jgi:hypothetical protein